MKHIVKRRGRMERYSEKKLADSVRYACQATHMEPAEAKKVVQDVLGSMDKWIKSRHTVTSQEIFREVAKTLKKHKQHDCAFMYEHHRDIS